MEEAESDVDGIFTKKKFSLQQIEDENKEYEKFLTKVEKKNKNKKGNNKSSKHDEDQVGVLKQFWGDASKLDTTDQFLRKYIMTKG